MTNEERDQVILEMAQHLAEVAQDVRKIRETVEIIERAMPEK